MTLPSFYKPLAERRNNVEGGLLFGPNIEAEYKRLVDNNTSQFILDKIVGKTGNKQVLELAGQAGAQNKNQPPKSKQSK